MVRNRYTHFVSIPVDHAGILSQLESFANTLRARRPELAKSLVQFERQHITLVVLKCPFWQEKEMIRVFNKISSEFFSTNENSIEISIRGIGCKRFSKRDGMVYADCSLQLRGLLKLANYVGTLQRTFKEMKGVVVDIRPDLFLHTTLVRTTIGNSSITDFDRSLLEEIKDFDFGIQPMHSIYLSAMTKVAPKGTYYRESQYVLPELNE